MAAWQFVLDLIPSSAATSDGIVAARMSRDRLDAIELNFSGSIADAIIERVGTILPEKQAWATDLRIWGDDKTDDIQIGFSGTAIQDVQFRLDAADLSLSLVKSICALAREFDCVLVDHSGAIVRPFSEAVVRMIMKSEAHRFVNGPSRYLHEAAQCDPEFE